MTETNATEVARPRSPFKTRFNGREAWQELTFEQQARIGAAALELVVNWRGDDYGCDFHEVRPFQEGELIILDELEEAVNAAIPGTLQASPLPVPSLIGPVCRECGCSERDPCDDGCSWVEPDLCSACASDASWPPI
jgi:hypothetical protein